MSTKHGRHRQEVNLWKWLMFGVGSEPDVDLRSLIPLPLTLHRSGFTRYILTREGAPPHSSPTMQPRSKGVFIATQLNSTQLDVELSWVELRRRSVYSDATQLNSTRWQCEQQCHRSVLNVVTQLTQFVGQDVIIFYMTCFDEFDDEILEWRN